MNKKIVYSLIIIFLVVSIMIFNINLFGESNEIEISYENIIKEMFPKQKFEFLDTNHVRIYSDEEHFIDYLLEQIVFGKYIQDKNEFLVILKVPRELTSHSAGFYQVALSIFDKEQQIISPVKYITADEGEFGFFDGLDKRYVMFVGNTTFQGWTEYNGSLVMATNERWIDVFPEDKTFWKNKKVVIGSNRISVFNRVIERKGEEVIPNYYFQYEQDLVWNPVKNGFNPE